MARSDAGRRAYARGYNAGIQGRWPKELSATVPNPFLGDVIDAAMEIDGAADALMAGFDDRDEEEHMVAMDLAREKLRRSVRDLLVGIPELRDIGRHRTP